MSGAYGADDKRRSALALAVALLAISNPDILTVHLRRALDETVWKYTEADGKYKTRFRSAGALIEEAPSQLRHEHVVPRKLLVDRMLAEPDRVAAIMSGAIGCVVTLEEHRRLTNVSRSDPALEGWDRYSAADVAVVDTWGDRTDPSAGSAAGSSTSTSVTPRRKDALTQAVANAILRMDPTRGRAAIAREMGIPGAVVWAVRGAAGMLNLNAESTAYVKARVARAGVTVAFPAPSSDPNNTATATGVWRPQ